MTRVVDHSPFNKADWVEIFKNAAEAAQDYQGRVDDGPVNHDAVGFFPSFRVSNRLLRAAAKEANVQIRVGHYLDGRFVFLNVTEGTAARRTYMAEGAKESLKASGLAAAVRYRMEKARD